MKKLIGLALIAVLTVGCNSSAENSTQSAQEQLPDAKDGRLEFEETSHDFGEITEGDVVSYAFKFKNVGTDPVEIAAVNVSCGCTVASKPAAPVGVGQEDEIVINFNSKGKVGQNRKTVGVISNARNNAVALNFTATVKAADAE
ncbi:DUF1573 domain-containing protein [Jiulongibacter sp. NS-SX5]|uniref:DUF1573 domain-containing protein n=1 Tax=Jiulongibacter sp. NS-SX5 TaxID=3463854 RepID=UPI00405A3C7D